MINFVMKNRHFDIWISEHDFLYNAYPNDITFVVKKQTSAIDIWKFFGNFSKSFGLKPNKSKCEISRIGALKVVRVAIWGLQCINLNEETVKILGIHFSYKVWRKKEFNNHIAKIKNVLRA